MPPSDTTEAPPLLAVKLGGSLWASPARAGWIAALRRYPGALALVPGGGPFADAVRAAQPGMGFSADAAHAMALLAMEQYARALADLCEGLEVFETIEDMRAVHVRGAIAVWRPFPMVRAAQDIAANWEVTSDSLAAWLARKTGASALLLVKSVDAPAGADPVSRGVVDPAFTGYAAGLTVHVAGPAALASAEAVLAGGGVPGTRFAFAPRQEMFAI
jgi:dihydroneopterin aldolase